MAGALVVSAMAGPGATAAAGHSPPPPGHPYPLPDSQWRWFTTDGEVEAVRYEGSPGADVVALRADGARDELTVVDLLRPASEVELRTGDGADVVTSDHPGATVDTGAGGDAVTVLRASMVRLGDGDDVVRTGAAPVHITCGAGEDTVHVRPGGPAPTTSGCEHVLSGDGASAMQSSGLVEYVAGGRWGTQRLAGPAGFAFGLASPAEAAGAECATGAASWTACAPAPGANRQAPLPTDGLHLLQIRPRLAGGALGLPAVLPYVQDTTPPAPPVLSPAPAPRIETGQTTSWGAGTVHEPVPIALEWALFPAGGAPSWTRLGASGTAASGVGPVGWYTLALRAVDPVGNVSPEVRRDFEVVPGPFVVFPGPPDDGPPFVGRGLPRTLIHRADVGLPRPGQRVTVRDRLRLRCPVSPCRVEVLRAGRPIAAARGEGSVVVRLGPKTRRALARRPLAVTVVLVDGDGRTLRAAVTLRRAGTQTRR